ncbi:glycosyl transferase group 1 [endosymbiont of unidentified scaly snail isolate Monju]|nr:glycosyl transferase group 1 [endosymbiont of unidentified scaly snail isolate Monju]
MVESEQRMLVSRGHEVATFFRHSDEIRGQGAWGAIKGALATPWNPFSTRAMRRALEESGSDVVHVHNTFPLISPSIFPAIGSRAARVLTLHNYRLFCPAAIPMRAGRVCTRCIDEARVGAALRHGCYRDSRLATAPLAANVALHRRLGTWQKHVDAFITLTEFQRQVMIDAGLPAEKVHVKPNFYPGDPEVIPWESRRETVVFVGRLSVEKGVETLLQAWRQWGTDAPELRIVGDGPLAGELRRLGRGLPVCFLGQLPPEKAQEEIGRARLLVLPSECFEGFPMVIGEAFALGTPAAVSRIGPLPEIVRMGEAGVVFAPGDPDALLEAVCNAWASLDRLRRVGERARVTFEEKYTESINYRLLMEIYETAMEVNKKRAKG